MGHLIQDKKVVVKVGVLVASDHSNEDGISTVEFDPRHPVHISDRHMMLPFIVWTVTASEVPFYLHRTVPACASALEMAGLAIDSAAYHHEARKACTRFMAANPRKQWFRWGAPAPTRYE